MISQFFTWQTILDILVMAGGLFLLYRTLMRLGTWKIVSGILIAGLFFVCASLLGLKGIEWIYRNVSHVAVISLVVLFQPELRKLFEQAASIRRGRRGEQNEQFASLIAESMWRLAQQKIGAIIVIPGKESIQEWAKGGYRLNAQPSIPLILSIFDPNSPGHDGALIFQKGIFSSFGVRLPVSQSGRLPDEYGTRHQASMGLSEKSDALVVVASEERGMVSVFQNGTMTVMPSEKHIFEALSAHCRDTGFFHKGAPKKKFGRALALEVSGSLAAAVLLWVTIIAGQGEMLEKVITAPVEYTATAENVVMTGEKAKEVKLHLTGPKSDLGSVGPSTVSVKIDLSQAVEGKQTVLISEENIRLPRGVRLIDVEPASVEINIAKLAKVLLPIKPQLIGNFPQGLKLETMEIRPEKVTAFLPSGKAGEKFKQLTTTPVYLSNIRETTTLFCKIIAPPAIQPVDKRWPDVEILLTVEPETDVQKKKKVIEKSQRQ